MLVVNRSRMTLFAAAIVGFAVAATAAMAEDVAQFYRGKTIRMVIGYGVGGGYDLNARLAARFLGKHLPGNPSFVPQNMPGASGMTATGYLYQSAPKDGTVMGTIPVNLARDQILKIDETKFDATKFIWVGRMTSGAGTHFAWYKSGLTSFADLKSRDTVAAGTGPQANSVVYPLIANELLGTRIKPLKGFNGTSEATLALQRGEVDLVLEPWQTIKSGSAEFLRDKQIVLLVQYTSKRHPDLKDVPTILEFCETEEQRKLFRLLLSTEEIGRSLVLPPGVPAERAQAMRDAFDAIMTDAEMLKEADVQRMDLDMMSGKELEQLVLASFDTPADIVARLRAMLVDK